MFFVFLYTCIISISKLLGNYNLPHLNTNLALIISISKLLGNYNLPHLNTNLALIISISKLLGNYNIEYVILSFIILYQYLNC